MPEFAMETKGLPEVKFAKGALLLEEGKRAKGVYVLKDGAVAVLIAQKEICKVNDALAIFGEMSVLLDSEATATVVAESDCTCYFIKDLMAHLRGNPDAALHVAQVMALRIANMNTAYIEIKNDIAKLQKLQDGKVKSKLGDLMAKMDKFWGQEIWKSPAK